jgi:hypothetical protein
MYKFGPSIGIFVSNETLGYPSWPIIRSWLNKLRPNIRTTSSSPSPPSKKFPEIPALPSYRCPPPHSFWELFPKHTNTNIVTTSVNTKLLDSVLTDCQHSLSPTQLSLAKKCIDILKNGSKTSFAYPFEFVRMPNASSAM